MAAKNATTQSQIADTPGATIDQVQHSEKGRQTQVRVDGTDHLNVRGFPAELT
jgi:hypothetical protein